MFIEINTPILTAIVLILFAAITALTIQAVKRTKGTEHGVTEKLNSIGHNLSEHGVEQLKLAAQLELFLKQQRQLEEAINGQQKQLVEILKEQEINSLKNTRENIDRAFNQVNDSLSTTMKRQQEGFSQQINTLTTNTERHLTGISQKVNEKLTEGFAKTGELFQNVLNRLLLIDKAQEKISELTHHVVDLQSVLNDKRSRGAFGEVQLTQIIKNTIPQGHFKMQATLSNGNRVDCILLLPEPTGHIIIDAKFPLETFRTLAENPGNQDNLTAVVKQFKKDIKFHIDSIADKYIIPHETADGAMMFIPAEAVFAEIHANHPDIVSYAQQRRVWLTSPTTLMAVLTTASAVIRDVETRQHVQAIQKHLRILGEDFKRFYKRLDNLARHISQAHQDVDQIKTSSAKIQRSFAKIDELELSEAEVDEDEDAELEVLEEQE